MYTSLRVNEGEARLYHSRQSCHPAGKVCGKLIGRLLIFLRHIQWFGDGILFSFIPLRHSSRLLAYLPTEVIDP